MIKKFILTLMVICVCTIAIAQSPGNVSTDLKLWLKADAGILGATPMTGWLDQSASGNNATVVSNGPDVLNNQINFNPALDFTRTNSEYLQITAGIMGNTSHQNAWVYYISKPNATNQRTTIFFEELNGTNEYFGSLNVWENGNAFFDFGNVSGGRLTGNVGSAAGVYNMWAMGSSNTTATPNGTNKAIYRDGQAVLSTNNNDATVTGNNRSFFIGGRYREVLGNYFDGQIAELIIYEAVPSELEQEKVQSYLAVKYGIAKMSLDNGGTVGQDERDYFASDGAVIWDYSVNSAYINGITGIGRDDNSGLSQQKSRSSNIDGAVTIDKGGAFTSDKDFLLWGNNGAITTSTDVPSAYTVRSNRVWKVDASGVPGTVSFSIDLSIAGLLNTGDANDYALLIDGDAIFNAGATVHTTGISLVGNELSFTNVSFSDGDFFAIAIDNFTSPTSPGSVSTNLLLWLKADAGVTGSAPVSAWSDQSSVNNDATVVGNGPDLLSSQLNFNPALDFTRANSEYLQVTNGVLGNTAHEKAWVYYISKPNSINQRTTIFFEELSGTSEYFGSLNTWENGKVFFDFGNQSTGRLIGNGGTTSEVYNMWTMGTSNTTATPNGTNKALYKDGRPVLSSNQNDGTVTGSNQNFFIGGRFQKTDGNYYDGQIAELIIYESVPSELEQEKVQSYLALKYGISKASLDNTSTLTQDEQDYFDSGGTVIWDASANSTYHNGVTGIGRDDDSGLEQKQSRNSDTKSIVSIGLDDSSSPNGLESSNILNDGTFGADKAFLIWGHDAACLECDAARNNTEFSSAQVNSRLNREWRVQETGSTGTLTIEFDLSNLPGPSGTSTNTDDDVVLLVDADGDFSAGVTLISQSFVVTGDNKAVFRADLSDGTYFTLGSGENTALPVRLVSFTAKAIENHIALEWTTASEENNSHYRVERSTDGIHFTTLESIPGVVNSQQLQTYHFVDLRPERGNNYYRLTDVSLGGKEHASQLVKEYYEGGIPEKPYPNPVRRGEELKLNVPDYLLNLPLSIEVYDTSGRRRKFNSQLERNSITIDTNELEQGLYLLTISDGKKVVETFKVIVNY